MQTATNASQIYALLRRNYRISRNTRALWQFQQIARETCDSVKIPTTDEIVQSSDEIVLLSALDQNGAPISATTKIICSSSTRFCYFATRYKFAFILDMTDSCASVSIDGGHIYLESLTNCLCILLCSLSQKFTLPGCELKFQPEIDVSVYVYFPLNRTTTHQVLIHGYRLNWSTLESICKEIIDKLRRATGLLRDVMSNGQTAFSQSISSTVDSEENTNSNLNSFCSTGESSCAIINMLSYGITALQLMAEEATAALVIITDGILDVPNLSAFEAVMRQIRARIISCSFVQTGISSSTKEPRKSTIASLGHVPNEELLKFISLSTFGSFIYFDVESIAGDPTLLKRLFSEKNNLFVCSKQFNDFQHELLSWGFHKAVIDQQKFIAKRISLNSFTIESSRKFSKLNSSSSLPISRKLVNQTVLQTSLGNVLSLRLREGYTIKSVQIQKDEIEVHLVLPWHYEIQIYYVARSVWPLEKSVRTDIRVFKEAPIYFLQELNQNSTISSMKNNVIRNKLAQRYNDVIQTVSVVDRHLTLINTFSKNEVYYRPLEPSKRGKSIFYLTQNDMQQTLLHIKDKELQSFADFWRPILILDGSLWQRFMFTHNLTIILVHDPLNSSLLLSQSHGNQHSSVSCRLAKSDFEIFLAEYFSFVLLDGQAYIKFLMSPNDEKIPYSFMLLRIMGQPPLLYLKFAFQANATNVERHKIIEEFRNALSRARLRSRMKSGTTISDTTRKQQTSTPISTSSGRTTSSNLSSAISQRITAPCCVFLNKNIERLMLKPDPFPYESLGIQRPDDDDLQHKQRSEFDSKRQALSKFFFIQTFVRTFESIKHASSIPKRFADVIIDTFVRRRLQEGFHFAISHNHVHNLILELTMNPAKTDSSSDVYRLNPDIQFYPDEKIRTCLVQYRIYPVEYGRSTDTSPMRENRSPAVRRSSSMYCDQPTFYYFLTQIWVEPQDGFVQTNVPELEFLNQCTYKQIVDKIDEVDKKCFNTLVSYYFAKYLQERSLALPRPIFRSSRAQTNDLIRAGFVQDTISLIHLSPQTQFDFSAFIDDYERIKDDYIKNDGNLSGPSLNSTLLSILRERFCSKNFESKSQLFNENPSNHHQFSLNLIFRSNHQKSSRLPIGLEKIKSSPFLLQLLNNKEQQKSKRELDELEKFLSDMLFPEWEFLVSGENDDSVLMLIFPRSERDLFLLNTDLNVLMIDLCEKFWFNQVDENPLIYSDCRSLMEKLLDKIELENFQEKTENISNKEKTLQRGRTRRETFTCSDFSSKIVNGQNLKTKNGSSAIPISHSFSHQVHQSTSQPSSINSRRICSPLTVENHSSNNIENSQRRHSASGVVLPSSLNSSIDVQKNFNDRQWTIPLFLYKCSKFRLASSLLLSADQQAKNFSNDIYRDCTKDENESNSFSTNKTRRRENSRRQDEERSTVPERQIQEIRETLDFAFATAFYKNCLLDLSTQQSDVEYALNSIYQDHYESIDLTEFLRSMCAHLRRDKEKNFNENHFETICEPTTKHILNYLNEKFFEIINKYFRRVSPDSEFFYFCTDDERLRQSRNSLELDDRMSNGQIEIGSSTGPFKFEETNSDDQQEIDFDAVSTGTVQFHEQNDDDEQDFHIAMNRRQSNVSSGSLSNRSRELLSRTEILPFFLCFSSCFTLRDINEAFPVKTIPVCITQILPKKIKKTDDLENFRASLDLICVTFGREENESQPSTSQNISSGTPTFHSTIFTNKKLNDLDTIETGSTCTATTMIADVQKSPLEKLRLSDAQRRAIFSCRNEIEWFLRDEQLSTYFSRRTLDRNFLENVIEHVESSVNIQKSNCLCKKIDLMFVLGIEKSIGPFTEELTKIRIREKFVLAKCGEYFVLIEPMNNQITNKRTRQVSTLSFNSSDDQSSMTMDESSVSDSSLNDEEENITEDELEDFVQPSFWLFIQRTNETRSSVEQLQFKLYLYCGSSSDTSQNCSQGQRVLEELMTEFKNLCRTINQKLLLKSLADTCLCNPLLVPPGENDDTTTENDGPVLGANLTLPPGEFACDELWTHSFPLHIRIRGQNHGQTGSKSSSNYHPGALLRELKTHFSSLAVHNRKNLFIYRDEPHEYYMTFREDVYQPSTPSLIDEPIQQSDAFPVFQEPPSPQIGQTLNSSFNSSNKNRQRHDSGTSCIHVTLYGLQSSAKTARFEEVKNTLIRSIVSRLEDEVVKELVIALYHFAMTRLNPEDVAFIRPVDSEPRHVFEYKISSSINTTVFLYYFRRYVKTNKYHQPLLLPLLVKDIRENVKDYRGQTLIVYNRTHTFRIPRPGLAWIELHILNSSSRPSPFSADDFTEDFNVQSLIDLMQIEERKNSTNSNEQQTENILRCNVWARGSQFEIDPNFMSSTLLQAFTFALADYITEYKLLPRLYANQRQNSFEPPPSPRSMTNFKGIEEINSNPDRITEQIPSTPTIQTRRRQESMQNSMFNNSWNEEPQNLSVENVECLTKWFQYLTTYHQKIPSLISTCHTLTNRILVTDIIRNFTVWLNCQKLSAYKESLCGTTYRCNPQRTIYLPVVSLDQLPTHVPGQTLDLIVLYQSSKMTNEFSSDGSEPSPQQDPTDPNPTVNSSDVSKQIFLYVVAKDKKLTMILHNAPEELGKILTNYFANLISWSNRRLDILNMIVTQKMGLFRNRTNLHESNSEFNRHHGQTGKYQLKNEKVDLEQAIKEILPPKVTNASGSWNIDLLFCNLNGSYPILPNDQNQDLVQRHGSQLLQLREQRKLHMDRCTKLEEICSNWILKPKLFIGEDLLTQMKHRSRLLSISVVPILFSRQARSFFQNDSTLKLTNSLSLVDFQMNSNSSNRLETSRLNNIEQIYIQLSNNFLEQLSNHLHNAYKFHPISTKSLNLKNFRSSQISTTVEQNFHRSDSQRRSTILAEICSLNHVQLIVRFLQYDIVKTSGNHLPINSLRQNFYQDFCSVPEQNDLDGFVYDLHLQTIVRQQTKTDENRNFPSDFSLINFLQEFIEFFPTAPIGSRTALFKTTIRNFCETTRRQSETNLFKYVFDHAPIYGVKSRKQNSDEFLFDLDATETFWIVCRTSPSSNFESPIVMFLIYTNLSPKTVQIPNNKISGQNVNNQRIANSFKQNSTGVLTRERAATFLNASTKAAPIFPRTTTIAAEQQQNPTNIPAERSIEIYRSKLTEILERAALSHRRESLWDRLINSRPENSTNFRPETNSISVGEFQALLDSCVTNETTNLLQVTSLLQRVFSNKEQSDRLARFFTKKYGSQYNVLSSSAVNFFIIFQAKAPQPCDAFLVLIHRPDQNNLKSFLVKHKAEIDCEPFVRVFTNRISYFLWECLI